MKKLIFSGNGFPGTIKTLEAFQNNFFELQQWLLFDTYNYTVLWGMEEYEDGETIYVSDGAFVFAGEIIPFAGGIKADQIKIEELVENGNFNTNPSSSTSVENMPAYSSKSAQFGIGGIHSFATENLKRYNKLFDLSINNVHGKHNGFMVPKNFLGDSVGIHFLGSVLVSHLNSTTGKYEIMNGDSLFNRLCVKLRYGDVGVCHGLLEITDAISIEEKNSLDDAINNDRTFAYEIYNTATNIFVGTSILSTLLFFDMKRDNPDYIFIKIGTMLRVNNRYYIDVNPQVII